MGEGTYRSSDGLNLFYRSFGEANDDKVPVLCLPGITRNSLDFSDVAPMLAKSRRVYCLDFRGRGESDYDPNYQNYQPMTYAGDVLAFCDAMGLTKVILIGTSLGGIVSMGIATVRPDLLEGVVINDIGPELDPVGLERISSYTGAIVPGRNWDEAVAVVRENNEFAHPLRTDEFWKAYARRVCKEDESGMPQFNYDPKIGDALRETPPAPQGAMWPLFDALKSIPTLVVRGAISDLLSEETVTKMQDAKPDLDVVRVADVGHAPWLDEPDAFAGLSGFLARLS